MILYCIVSYGQEDYLSEKYSASTLNEKRICKYAKKSASKCRKLTSRTKNIRVRSLSEFAKAEDELLGKLCSINERQAETLLRNSLYSYRGYEALIAGDSQERSTTRSTELDSTALAIAFIDNKFPMGCNCDGINELKQAKAELDAELKRSESTAKYISDRRQYLSKVAGSEKSLIGSVQAIEKTDHYFNTAISEYVSLFQDRSIAEKLFFQSLSHLLSGQMPSDEAVLANALKSTSSSAGYTQSLETIKDEFQEAAQRTGRTASELLPANVSPQESGNHIQWNKDETLNALEINSDSLAATRVDENAIKSQFQNQQRDSSINQKSEWKKNPLKTKRFQDRLNYGVSFQADPRTKFFPTSGAINGQLGFQITVKMNLGIGGSYLIGLDKQRLSSNDIKQPFSTSGYSLKSYANHQIKGPLLFQLNFELCQRQSVSEIQLNRTSGQYDQAFMVGLKLRTPKSKRYKQTAEIYYDIMHTQTGQPAIVMRFGLDFLPKHAYKN